MSLEELTKKEQIINFARNDPFLKISDIAEHVKTTPRYVRTILSEANISLMKLREKYARNMEERLQVKESNSQKAEVRLINQKGEVTTGKIKLSKITNKEFRDLRKTHPEQELYKISQKRMIDGEIFGVQEIITYLNPEINKERIENLDSLYELFGDQSVNKLNFKNNIMQVENANQFLAKLLGISNNNPIIKSQKLILIAQMPIAIENCFFDADKVQLIIPGELIV
ncbi:MULTISPECIES: UTRA domain-containing protein [unclassified Candidatus Frackibacter]|uniref:UTRA domain-containing protein n=1 Tax=unclassified Candidatus Frackibacter TaxID=2648818 RepID=UPI00079A79DB|nr:MULTISPECIES: UTRA domain-containing protein [unclassified Candidatus Frackibacter]KXS42794.1 MAG: GntR family transcriptional regulator [Candidatus Frackibacter sp. T328-2]SDC30306.1 UTRA domain-containing protein [Candidatus Frackibacter sp. WG11]SEM95015.1 UTRA domain-containing protein [Candidatus Frackibacter sp. WG12]SFL58143.1 UTRA domain-containing protein [Candidatus Frackibacter sp. WG13]